MPAAKKTKDPASPTAKAHSTGRWAEIMFRALSTRVAKRWKFISFRGAKKGEWRGVVDLIAIRKDTRKPEFGELKRGDLFDVILVQVKGGSAKPPSLEDKQRLQAVAKYYHATAVVHFAWKSKEKAEFSVLESDLTWKPSSGAEIFG